MKYFTSEWWESGGEDESVIEKYREYYLSISSKLPGELRSFEENHTLQEDCELGDLGYWECETIGDHIQMRMLFASGAQFSDFRFSYVQSKA